jgi:hypothetical protein
MKRVSAQYLFDFLISSSERIVVSCWKGEHVSLVMGNLARWERSRPNTHLVVFDQAPLSMSKHHDRNVLSRVILGPERVSDGNFGPSLTLPEIRIGRITLVALPCATENGLSLPTSRE